MMRNLKAVLVEDEFHSRQTLRNLIEEYCPELEILGEASSAEEAIFLLQTSKPDLVLMDIELGDGTAFDVLKTLADSKFQIIFTTAHEHYALKAIKFNALDYLLKPIDVDELQEAISKVTIEVKVEPANRNLEYLIANLNIKNEESRIITLSTSESYVYVQVGDIIRCEAQGAYTRFYIRQKTPLLVSKTLKEYEHLLQDHAFIRVHQSHLISLHEVDQYIKSDGGYIVLRDGSKIGVSRGRREAFLSAMEDMKK